MYILRFPTYIVRFHSIFSGCNIHSQVFNLYIHIFIYISCTAPHYIYIYIYTHTHTHTTSQKFGHTFSFNVLSLFFTTFYIVDTY